MSAPGQQASQLSTAIASGAAFRNASKIGAGDNVTDEEHIQIHQSIFPGLFALPLDDKKVAFATQQLTSGSLSTLGFSQMFNARGKTMLSNIFEGTKQSFSVGGMDMDAKDSEMLSGKESDLGRAQGGSGDFGGSNTEYYDPDTEAGSNQAFPMTIGASGADKAREMGLGNFESASLEYNLSPDHGIAEGFGKSVGRE